MTDAVSSDVQRSSGFQAATFARRGFLVHAGRGVVTVAVLGLAACTTDEEAGPAQDPARSGSAAGFAWHRVDLAYVSAYVLVRGRQAAVVDTGYKGGADRIGVALEAAGTGWDGVRHVLITHDHGDHADGLDDVAERATGANGEDVFGLQVATPGHTPGHIAVFDADSSVVVAGDALTNTLDGMLAGALPVVTVDPAAAADSVRKLATLDPRVILVGHGPPVEHDAATKLGRLARSLTGPDPARRAELGKGAQPRG